MVQLEQIRSRKHEAAYPARSGMPESMKDLLFSEYLYERCLPRGVDVETALAHFAIVTYLVDPTEARRHIHPRFELDLVEIDGVSHGLFSVVPFVDVDFHFANAPWFKWTFGQTNYRIYVTDLETGEHVVWFLGTTLDSSSVVIPRYFWSLPWHRGRIRFDCKFDEARRQYFRYKMTTTGSWADGYVELEDTGMLPKHLNGFDNLEAGLVVLTHPRLGYYYRRDGQLGSYSIWHDRLAPTLGKVVDAKFELLDRLELTTTSDLSKVHSVLMLNRTDFTVYLPPRPVATVANVRQAFLPDSSLSGKNAQAPRCQARMPDVQIR
jgi:hypothetical protein